MDIVYRSPGHFPLDPSLQVENRQAVVALQNQAVLRRGRYDPLQDDAETTEQRH
jgi:hypothetical protein